MGGGIGGNEEGYIAKDADFCGVAVLCASSCPVNIWEFSSPLDAVAGPEYGEGPVLVEVLADVMTIGRGL
jgi:hypothetical protein